MYNVKYIFNLKYVSRITSAQQTQDEKEEEYYFARP